MDLHPCKKKNNMRQHLKKEVNHKQPHIKTLQTFKAGGKL